MPRRSPYVPGARSRLLPLWVPCACTNCSELIELREPGRQGSQRRICEACRRRRNAALQRKHEVKRKRDRLPYGKKSGVCAACGKVVWKGRGSTSSPTCRDCRRDGRGPSFRSAPTWWFCEECGEFFEQSTPRSRFCSRYCAYAATRLYADPRHASRISARKRRAKHAATWDGVTDEQIWQRDNWTCQLGARCLYPGQPLDQTPLSKGTRPSRLKHPLYPTVDHVVPISRGGADTSVNKRAAHLDCNCARGTDMTPDEEALVVRMPELAPLGVWPKPKKRPKLKPPRRAKFPANCYFCEKAELRSTPLFICALCSTGKCNMCGKPMAIVVGSRPPETRRCLFCTQQYGRT